MQAGKDARGLLTAHQAKGAGYAISRPEELQTVIEVAESTGEKSFTGRAMHQATISREAASVSFFENDVTRAFKDLH